MKSTFRTISLVLAFALVIGATGCAMMGKADDLYIFNGKGESAMALSAAAKAFEAETGKKVRTFSLGSGTSSIDTLRAEMNSKNMPTIFSIVNLQELKEWEEGGFVLDFNKIEDSKFKDLASSVPENMRLTSDGTTNYGIPYNVEGYGYIVDTRMADALFGDGVSATFVRDAKGSTYDEFRAMVEAVDKYIKEGTPSSFALNGTTYTLRSEKTDMAKKLTGVFAVAGADKWTYGDHMINVALNAVFSNPAEAAGATARDIESIREPMIAYAKALDFKTTYAAGKNGPLKRGPEFINTTTSNYDSAVDLFANSKALFIKQGNWAYTNIEKANSEIVKTLEFIPVKLPIEDSAVTAKGMTANKLNRSISVFVPNYYAINAKASKEQQQTAMEFLLWLNTTAEGQKFVTEDMAFIPYNADHNTLKSENSLTNSILKYMSSGDVISNPFGGAPVTWTTDVVGLDIMEKYLIKPEWSEEDYKAIADNAIEKWKKMAGVK